MGSDELLVINCSKELRFEGSEVSGTVNLNVALAKEKEISAIKISLKGGVHTWEYVSTATGGYQINDQEPLFKFEETIWTPDTSIPDRQYNTISLPFKFTIPQGASSLPPSMHSGNSLAGSRIQYYVHVVAEKPAWFKRNTRVNAPFPLLPLDRTTAPTLRFDNWSGPWSDTKKVVEVRQNALKLFGGQGSIDATIRLPQVESFPLFTRIPIQLHITCASKPLPSASSSDPSTFTFPRIPKINEIHLQLTQHHKIVVLKNRRSYNEKHGPLGGFGTIEKSDDIRVERTEPVWMSEEGKGDKEGRWKESVTYTGFVIFRCPTPVNSKLVRTETNIEAKIDFQGVGNTWKATIGPLPLSSGVSIAPPQGISPGSNAYDIAIPPSYWDVIEDGKVMNKDEKDEKKGFKLFGHGKSDSG